MHSGMNGVELVHTTSGCAQRLTLISGSYGYLSGFNDTTLVLATNWGKVTYQQDANPYQVANDMCQKVLGSNPTASK